MATIVGFISQKGGVGKTTTAINLAGALVEDGLRVLCIDMDPQANLTAGLGINLGMLFFFKYLHFFFPFTRALFDAALPVGISFYTFQTIGYVIDVYRKQYAPETHAGRFALFVSTIEPRKGHATLLAAWQRLLAQNIPQLHDFRLVFVGRPGWMVDDVLRRLDPPPWGVRHFSGCSDERLASLYRHAAFCCYPSQYEGYGLPLIEAFARGKAVVSSSGGALPETAGGLAPILDPLDVEAWAAMLGDWIAHPEQVAAREQDIAAHFHHPDWPAAAAAIIGVLSRPAPSVGDFRASAGRTYR